MELRNYLKYYWLEKYLEDEVKAFFDKEHYITAEHFLAIVIWKRNASKTKIREGIINTQKTIRELSSEVYNATTPKQKFEILNSIKGIGLSFASAILTILYPNQFTVADYRASNSLERFNADVPKIISTPADYFKYLKACKKLAEKNGLSLRDFDRAIWGMDFYDGEGGLKNLAEGL